MYRGSCLCGGIQYSYAGELSEIAICHCSQCRRAQGAPFATNAPVDASAFTLLQGDALLRSYLSSPNKRRVFCSQCGSPLYSQRLDKPDILRLRVGTLHGDIPIRPAYHIYYASKADWFDCDDDLPKYAANKP